MSPRLFELKTYLDRLVEQFERTSFIQSDPIAIPHAFDNPRDQEIIGLYAALLAWGQRKTILNKMELLCTLMQYQPASFVRNFDRERDGHRLAGFKHRTFQPQDAVWFTANLARVLARFKTIENAFSHALSSSASNVESALQTFSDLVFTIHPDTPTRLRKHLARPSTGSACKRLNMYLRWMVRPGPVDFGIWTTIRPDQLLLPLDVHSGRQARALGMLSRKQDDWKSTLELTENCRKMAPEDPCKYDYAFFGIGANGLEPDKQFIGENRLDVGQYE